MRYVIFLLIALNCVYFTSQTLLNSPGTQDTHPFPPLPPDVRQLVTLQELQRDEQPLPADTGKRIEDLTAAEPPGAVIPMTCKALGPILAKSELKALEQRLGKLGLDPKPQTRYVQEQVGYSVLLPARQYDEAVQIKRRLENENFTTIIIGIDNVISLGSFSDESQAKKILARADALGLDPRIEPSYAKRSTYWLIFPERENRDPGLTGLIRKHPDLRMENTNCP